MRNDPPWRRSCCHNVHAAIYPGAVGATNTARTCLHRSMHSCLTPAPPTDSGATATCCRATARVAVLRTQALHSSGMLPCSGGNRAKHDISTEVVSDRQLVTGDDRGADGVAPAAAAWASADAGAATTTLPAMHQAGSLAKHASCADTWCTFRQAGDGHVTWW